MTATLDPGRRALLAALAVPTLAACGGIVDEFLPNTEHGRLEVQVARAVNTNPANVTEFMFNERLRFARGMLAHTLPAGVEVHVDVQAAEFSPYRFGGGWITKGDLHLGRHAVPTATIDVVSSDVNVVKAEIVPNPTDRNRQWVKLTTLQPGTVRLNFKASKVDDRRQRIGAPIEDSFALTVSASAGGEQGVVKAMPGQ